MTCRGLILGLALTVAALPGFAKEKQKERVRKYDKVVSVDAANKEITIVDHQIDEDITWKINQFTKITVNGEPGKLEDIRKGMKISVSGSASMKTATSIEAEPYPVEEKKKK